MHISIFIRSAHTFDRRNMPFLCDFCPERLNLLLQQLIQRQQPIAVLTQQQYALAAQQQQLGKYACTCGVSTHAPSRPVRCSTTQDAGRGRWLAGPTLWSAYIQGGCLEGHGDCGNVDIGCLTDSNVAVLLPEHSNYTHQQIKNEQSKVQYQTEFVYAVSNLKTSLIYLFSPQKNQ